MKMQSGLEKKGVLKKNNDARMRTMMLLISWNPKDFGDERL